MGVDEGVELGEEFEEWLRAYGDLRAGSVLTGDSGSSGLESSRGLCDIVLLLYKALLYNNNNNSVMQRWCAELELCSIVNQAFISRP